MVCSAQRVLIFLIFVGLLAVEPDKVVGSTSEIKQSGKHLTVAETTRRW